MANKKSPEEIFHQTLPSREEKEQYFAAVAEYLRERGYHLKKWGVGAKRKLYPSKIKDK